jgi:hypothetical protein
MWAGLAVSYFFPSVPPSFAIIATAVLTYAASGLRGKVRPGLVSAGGRPFGSNHRGESWLNAENA